MSQVFEIVWSFKDLIIIVFSLIIIVYLIFQKGNPYKTVAWILIILFVPVIGIILFFIFGRTYKKKKYFNQKEIYDSWYIQSRMVREKFNEEDLKNLKVEQKSIINLLKNNSKSALHFKNEVEIFFDGSKKFETLIRDIDNAKNHIHMYYYIIEEGEVLNAITDKIIKKAKEGVKVRILYDDVGSWSLSDNYKEYLRKNNVEIFPFLPIRFPIFAQKFFFRNHRKIVVIDNCIGYTGGMNLADRYKYGRRKGLNWRDTHIRIKGESVISLQAIFISDWYFVTKELININTLNVKNNEISNICPIQIVPSGPDNDWNSIMQAYFYIITNSKNYLYITTPYFLPNESILTAIKTISLSGVDVRIVLPFYPDSKIMHYGTYSYFPELLEANVKIFLYKKGFIHSKIILSDDTVVSIGSANIDLLSFNQNFELSAIIYDENIIKKVKEEFLKSLEDCHIVKIEDYWNKPFTHHFVQGIARLFTYFY